MAATWKRMRMAGRQWVRHIQRAIRGSWIRALAELVTNADDSYARLERAGQAVSGAIYVAYERSGDTARFFVTDEAEGMTADRMRQVFEEYGGEIAAGNAARGFFNRGAKDALLGMEGGFEESIVDGEYARVDLRLNSAGEPEVRVTGPAKASARKRREMEFEDGNGTCASFALPRGSRLPQYETVRNALAAFSMLRKIVDPENKKRSLILLYRGQEEEITFPAPAGEVLLDRHVVDLAPEGHPRFKVSVTLKKAEEDLDQSPSDQRVGGLLILDEGDAVLDLTLGRFDRDPAATPFFGEVKLRSGFKRFMRREEKAGRHVLSDERNGLESTHPWVQAFLREIERILEPFVEAERRARATGNERMSAADREHNRRIIDELNRIMEEETRKAWSGGEESDLANPPASGLEIRPNHLVLAEGGRQRYAAIVADFDKVKPGEIIYVDDDASVLQVEPDEIKVERELDEERVFVRYVRLSGGEAGQAGKIVAVSADCDAEATYEVVQESYPYFDGEMAFIPDEVSVIDQKPSTLGLYVKTAAIGPGESVDVVSSSPSDVRILKETVEVDPASVRGGVAKARVRVRGQGIGTTATVTATRQGVGSASVTVRVRSKVAPPKHKKGLFQDIVYSPHASDTERVHYEDASGNIVVHLREPTVQHHLGDEGQYRELLDSQTLVAELVTQALAQEVAARKVESGARVYFDQSAGGMLQEDLAEIRDLVHRYGPVVHRVVVDQELLKEARRRADAERD